MQLNDLKTSGLLPPWATEEGLTTLKGGYLLPGETPRSMYERVAKAAASYYIGQEEHWFSKFFDYMWKGWLCPSSPVVSNMGTERGLPISCYSIHCHDSVSGIFMKNHELAMLSKNGGGVGVYLGDIRGRGVSIKGNGKSEGVIPWSKCFDTTTVVTSQGGVRRGSSALYLPIDHVDIEEWLVMRRPTGDENRRCLNINHAVCISSDWMHAMLEGNTDKRKIWKEVLRTRAETGEPYLLFTDNTNDQNPECYKANNLKVSLSNLCSEIMLFTDPDHSFVCCLSSLNLTKFDEWKNSDLVETSVRFLDAVITEFINKSEAIPGLEPARQSAIKGRALGIGVLGWHTLLQEKSIPFDSFEAMRLNAEIFRTMRQKADEETYRLAQELGEPEWCLGHGRRNTHCLAVAPTVSNSTIAGGHSAGIEPISANIYSQQSAKGTFIRKNPTLEKLLDSKGKDDKDTWQSIIVNDGSVQHLDFLTNLEKEVFLTAREINQHAIIKQAAQRQRWIDQGQSVNLFFSSNSDPKYIHEVHLAAWEQGLKSLYYLRTTGVIKGDLASRSKEECSACEA